MNDRGREATILRWQVSFCEKMGLPNTTGFRGLCMVQQGEGHGVADAERMLSGGGRYKRQTGHTHTGADHYSQTNKEKPPRFAEKTNYSFIL